jgi:hypothetical protein
MTGIIYVNNETYMPFGVAAEENSPARMYADLIAPLITIAGKQLYNKTGAELVGFDVSGEDGKGVMFYRGETISGVYVSEKGKEINPAFLRDRIKSLETELKKEENAEIKRKIDQGDIDPLVQSWLQEKGILELKPVMMRSGKRSLEDLIKVNLDKGTITNADRRGLPLIYEKLRPKDNELKDIYATLRSGAKEIHSAIRGSEPKSVGVIVKYHGKVLRLDISGTS